MGTKVTRDALRGLLVHDSRLTLANVDTTNSSLTEQGWEPDQPTPTTKGYLDLESVGELSTDAEAAFNVNAGKSGAAVADGDGGRFRWRVDGAGATTWRGWLAPNKVTGVSFPDTTNGDEIAAVRTPEHKVVVVYNRSSGSSLEATALDPADDGWDTAVTVDSEGGSHPSIVRLPDNSDNGGRLICFYGKADATPTYTISASYSDDDGESWTLMGDALPGHSVASTATSKILAFYHPTSGHITLLVQAGSATLYHYVSEDLGASFDEVETITTSSVFQGIAGYLAPDGAVVIFAVDSTGGGTNNNLLWFRKSTPRGTFAGDPSYTTTLDSGGTADTSTSGYNLACTLDDEGAVWLFVRRKASTTTEDQVMLYKRDPLNPSTNLRGKWISASGTTRDPIRTGDNSENFDLHTAVPYKAGLLLLVTANGTTTGLPSTAAIHLGGYSSIDWTFRSFGAVHVSGSYSGSTWLATHLPASNSLWTVSGAGTPTGRGDGFEIVTSSNDYQITRDGATTGGAGNPCVVWAQLKVESGGSLATSTCAVRVRKANNTLDYDVVLRFQSTGSNQEARLYDNEAGAQIGSDITGLTDATLYDWLIALEGNKVTVAYKLPSATLWTIGIDAATMTDGGAGTTPNRVTWGHLATGSVTSTWTMLNASIDDETVAPGVVSQANPADLQCRAFSRLPQWLGDTEGYRIRAKGGSAFKGDAWDAGSRARYGYRNIHHGVEARRDTAWRTAATALTHLWWTPSGGDVTSLGSSSIGCYLYGFNAETIHFEGQQSGGTWDTLITFDGASTFGTSLTYAISGDTVTPATGGNAGDRVIEPGELVGGYVVLTDSNGGGSTTAHKILDNTGGTWREDTTSRAVQIRIDSPPTVTTPTTILILPPSMVGVAHGITTAYKAFRLRIPASQVTAEGYYTLGAFAAGPLLVFGMQYSWGRTLTTEAQVETVISRDGVPTVRSLGRPRRRAEFAWTDGIDTSRLYDSSPDPDYIVARDAAGYPGLALRDSAAQLAGLLQRTEGAQPVVYLPRIDPATVSITTYTYSSPARHLYGWPGSVITRQALQGDEAESEVVAINGVVIEEAG